MPLYLLNGEEYRMGKSYSDKSDGLNYIKDEEIAIRRGLAVEEVKKLRE